MRKNQGRREQVDGLVYMENQMPSKKKNNSWDIVLRHPLRKSGKKIYHKFRLDTQEGNIYVEFSNSTMNQKIVTATEHFLRGHSHVRKIHGESGTMTCAGLRVDLVTSSVTHYANVDRAYKKENTNHILKEAAGQFRKLLLDGCCKDKYEDEMAYLHRCNNIWTYGKQKVLIHPTYVFSKDLTNSIHRDKEDDSYSFAFFFKHRSDNKDGLTWFLFPYYGIAIECSKNTLISWDGRKMHHCSCTIGCGIYSFFASSKRNVKIHSNVKVQLNKKRKRSTIEEGDDVYIRDGNSIRLANAVYMDDDSGSKTLRYIYKAKYKSKGVLDCNKNNVFPAKDIHTEI